MSEVAVCGNESLFTQVTGVPIETTRGFTPYAEGPIPTAPDGIGTVIADAEGEGEGVGLGEGDGDAEGEGVAPAST